VRRRADPKLAAVALRQRTRGLQQRIRLPEQGAALLHQLGALAVNRSRRPTWSNSGSEFRLQDIAVTR